MPSVAVAKEGPDEYPSGRPGTPGPKAAGRGWRPGRRWLQIGGTAAAVTALVAVGIPALAAVTTSTVTYYACVTNSTGAIKVVGKTTVCGAGKHKISWNNIGPRGPRGLQGPRGATGPQGPPGVVNGYIDNSSGASLTNTG